MHNTTHLANLIHKRRQVLVQLRELGLQQGQLIEQGETTTLLKLLAVKQQVLAALQGVERKLAPFYDEDPDARPWPSHEERAACAREADECQTLLREVLELERQQEQQMLTRRNEAAALLRQVHAAGEAAAAYQVHGKRA